MYQISMTFTIAHQISLNLTKSDHILLNHTKFHHISPNLIESHQISPKVNVRVGLHVIQYYRGDMWCFFEKKTSVRRMSLMYGILKISLQREPLKHVESGSIQELHKFDMLL